MNYAMTFDLTTLQEGEAFLRRPFQLSHESEAELIAWLEFVLNKLRARHARKAIDVDGGTHV